MIGPLSIALPPVSIWTTDGGASLTVTVRKGLYHARAPYLPKPDVVIAPNAGLAVAGYAERWRDTLHLVQARRLPFVFTDYSEQSIEKGLDVALQCAGMVPSSGVCVNPFRMPLRQPLVRGGAVGLPTLANGFLAAFHTPIGAFRTIDAPAMDVTGDCDDCAPPEAQVEVAALEAVGVEPGREGHSEQAEQAELHPIDGPTSVLSRSSALDCKEAQEVDGAAHAMSVVDLGTRRPPNLAAQVGLATFDADACPLKFENFFRAATQLGVVSDLDVEVMRRAVETGRRTERWCISEHWAKVAQGVGMSARYRYQCDLSEAALQEASGEAHARAKARSPRHNGEWPDEASSFSLATCLEGLVTPRWRKLKEIGNEALTAGEYGLAAEWYQRAAALTDHVAAMDAFFEVLEESGNRTARRLAESQDDVWALLHKHLPDAPRKLVNPDFDEAQRVLGDKAGDVCSEYVMEPNRPRAVCLANAAAARLRQLEAHEAAHAAKLKQNPGLPRHIVDVAEQVSTGLLDQALRDAEGAVAACPEYQKGHYRMAQVLSAMAGKASAFGMDNTSYLKRAAAIEKAMARYSKRAQGRLPWWPGVELVRASVLKPMDFELVYALPFLDHEVRRIVSCVATAPRAVVKVIARLVSSNGGQCLVLDVELDVPGSSTVLSQRSFDGMGFHILDDENGEKLNTSSEHASALALQRYPPLLSRFLAELTGAGVHIDQLILGHGLKGEVKRVKAALQAHPGYEHIAVI